MPRSERQLRRKVGSLSLHLEVDSDWVRARKVKEERDSCRLPIHGRCKEVGEEGGGGANIHKIVVLPALSSPRTGSAPPSGQEVQRTLWRRRIPWRRLENLSPHAGKWWLSPSLTLFRKIPTVAPCLSVPTDTRPFHSAQPPSP